MTPNDPTNPDDEFDNIEDFEQEFEEELDEPSGAPNIPQKPAVKKDEIIAALNTEVDDLKDRVLRAVAEMENLRRRTQREVADARAYAIADFARDMLTATDNLERALMTVPQDIRDNADPAMKSLIEGIEMTEREMQRLMQKNGVKPIFAEGEKFDPHKHQAMYEVPNDMVPAGTVVQVMQTGFAIGERVLRPAMVGVAKGGPKAAPQPAEESAQEQTGEAAAQDEAPLPPEGEHVDKEV